MRFEKGDKVIVRDNEDGPFFVATFLEYDYFNGKAPDGITKYQDADGKVWWNGVCVQYSGALEAHLLTLSPKEQWEYCVKIKQGAI